MGGWIGNSVVFTWVACIPMSVIIMAVVSRGGLAAPLAAAFALLLGLVPALLEQGNEKHLQNIVPGDGDAKVRQLLIRISTETKGDVWTTTWPLIDQRAGRRPRYPVQQTCTVGSDCTEFAPTLQLQDSIQRGWDVIKAGKIDVVITPDNLTIFPLSGLLEERYVRCANLRSEFQLHHLFGQSYLPVQIWTSTRLGCQSLRKKMDL